MSLTYWEIDQVNKEFKTLAETKAYIKANAYKFLDKSGVISKVTLTTIQLARGVRNSYRHADIHSVFRVETDGRKYSITYMKL